MMKTIILGAGGIGSFVGAAISKNSSVVLVGRKEHVDFVNNSGLEVTGVVNEQYDLNAVEKPDSIDKDDIIILSTKATSNEEVVSEIKEKLHENNVILVLQNGLGNEDLIKEKVNCHVVRGIVTTGTTFLKPGKVEVTNLGELFLEDSPVSSKIVSLFDDSILNAKVVPDIKERIWKKLIINCVLNPMTAILRVKNGELSRIECMCRNVFDECLKISKAEGIAIDGDELWKVMMKLFSDSYDNKSSMYQDILKGRKTEIDFINGKIISLGRKHGINVPINESLLEIVKFLERC